VAAAAAATGFAAVWNGETCGIKRWNRLGVAR
jgi:hypothetical protein